MKAFLIKGLQLNKWWKSRAFGFLAVMLTIVGSILIPVWPVHAANTDDMNRLTVHCTYEKKAIDDVTVSLYRTADLDRNTGTFTPTGDFASLLGTEDLTKIDLAETNAAESEKLVVAVSKSGIQPDAVLTTDGSGRAEADGLADGLYLIIPSDMENYRVTPALICVPDRDNNRWLSKTDVEMKVAAVEKPKTTEEIPKTPKKKSPPQPVHTPANTGRKTEIVKTGDNSNVFLYAALVILAASVLCTLLVLKRSVAGKTMASDRKSQHRKEIR